MKRDILVIRMIAVCVAVTAGSLWIALFFSAQLAPPEPEIATLGRHLCLVIFVVTFVWCLALYAAFRKEQSQGQHQVSDRTGEKG